jgi:hypothetical protein
MGLVSSIQSAPPSLYIFLCLLTAPVIDGLLFLTLCQARIQRPDSATKVLTRDDLRMQIGAERRLPNLFELD